MSRPADEPSPTPARRVRIEKLATTGEGIARTEDGVAFVDRALPGELVETSIYEKRKRFWRGSLRRVLEPSVDRVESAHAGCGGCDWAHFAAPAAGRAKEELFLETMQRIGHLDAALFGTPGLEAGGAGYRLRSRLHVSGIGPEAQVGYFAPGTHRVVGVSSCEALAPATRSAWSAVERVIRESAEPFAEAALLEDLSGAHRLLRVTAAREGRDGAAWEGLGSVGIEGVRRRSASGAILGDEGRRRLFMEVGERSFQVSVDTFFQGNRHLVGRLAADVGEEAKRVAPGYALDAFGGVGLFAGALLDAGHRVVSVEADPEAFEDARVTREAWPDREAWELSGRAQAVEAFLQSDDGHFDVIVADPPRSGLGTATAAALARRTRRLMLYVSCDPATLARDLPALRAEGLEIRRVRLYDLFAFTHRVEALVALERAI